MNRGQIRAIIKLPNYDVNVIAAAGENLYSDWSKNEGMNRGHLKIGGNRGEAG